MRKKLFIGVFLAAVASIVAGEYLFNRSDAQDAKKSATDEKKSDLFDLLKKDLEAKKDAPPPLVFPPLPSPTPSVAKDDVPPAFPAIAPPKEVAPTPPTLTIPPPTLVQPKSREPKPSELVLPPPVVDVRVPSPVAQTVAPPLEPTKPQVADPKPAQDLVFPALPKDRNVKPAIGSDDPSLRKPNPATSGDPSHGALVSPGLPTPTAQPIAQEVAKIKDCPWSLQVEMIDGQTTVIATVNKKHEFKIVCKSLDLQTGNGTLKATGKVTITGDAFNGTCENLAIPLMEDRLVLEGGASVTIQKLATNVSDSKPAAFELKGETLNLRISELHSGAFMQTSWRKVSVDSNVKQATAVAPMSNNSWTPYGTLRRVNMRLQPGNENGVWQLEDRTGKVIATVLARVGGTLTQHEGQTISVYGTAEQIEGQRYLRVTHIALP